jgi:hypothetical protein
MLIFDYYVNATMNLTTNLNKILQVINKDLLALYEYNKQLSWKYTNFCLLKENHQENKSFIVRDLGEILKMLLTRFCNVTHMLVKGMPTGCHSNLR